MAKTMIYKSDQGKEAVQSFYTDLLSRLQPVTKQKHLNTAYGETFILERGEESAPAVFLLHGSSSNAAMWLAEMEKLSKTHRVIAVDILGEVGRSSENRPSFQSDDYAQWIQELMLKLSIEKASFVGCSLGGWIALDFAIHFPKKVEKLVLTASAGLVQVKSKTIFWIIITSLLGNWGFHKLNQMVYGKLKIDTQTKAFADLIRNHYIPRTDVLPLFSNDQLQKIKASTLFIGGDNDCFYNSTRSASRLLDNLVDVKCDVLPNTGHVLLHQSHRIANFLNSISNES